MTEKSPRKNKFRAISHINGMSRVERRLILCALAALILVFLCALAAPARAAAAGTGEPILTLVYGNNRYEYVEREMTAADFTVSEDFQKRGLGLSVERRMRIVDRLLAGGSEVRDAMLYCFPLLRETVSRAAAEVCCDPVEAEIRFYPDRTPMFEIRRSTPGYALREDRIYDDAYFALKRGLSRVALSVEPIKPTRTAEQLSAYTKLRASFSTSYVGSADERKHNVELALSRINGAVIESGKEFSFNGTVGRRTTANGFLPAKIIVGGKYTEGVGGGVCQASTTVYNCALRAGLKITKVSRHSLVPTYVAPSFDAMVNGSWSDLRFVNDTDGPLFIRTHCSDGVANVEMYSTKLPYEIECRSVTVSMGERPADEEFVDDERKYTEGMESGEKVRVSGGAPAVESEGYLVKRFPDGRTEETLIRKDKYVASAGSVAVAP